MASMVHVGKGRWFLRPNGALQNALVQILRDNAITMEGEEQGNRIYLPAISLAPWLLGSLVPWLLGSLAPWLLGSLASCLRVFV
jgi:hypothetical protein